MGKNFLEGYQSSIRVTRIIPASIAFGHPNADLSGIFLKPLRAWDYPNNLPFVPKRQCLLVHNSSIPLTADFL